MSRFDLSRAALWEPIDDSPCKPMIGELVAAMQAEGYSEKAVYVALRTLSKFFKYINESDRRDDRIEYGTFDRFLIQLGQQTTIGHGERKALHRLRSMLVSAKIVDLPAPATDPQSALLDRFFGHLRRNGYRSASITSYGTFCRPFIGEVWDRDAGISCLKACDVLTYIERHVADHSRTTAALMCSRLRVFLRYARAEAILSVDLAGCVPRIRAAKRAGLPSHMSTGQLNAILDGCDRTTEAGKRDYAIFLLLARLGLRANEVSTLTLDAFDWRQGLIHIVGKGGSVSTMPLPDDVGSAVVDYICHGRPDTKARGLFHRVETPKTAFTTAAPVILAARRAFRRAGITGITHKSHSFRHTLATDLIRAGATLAEIGQVLRHQDQDTTRIYAKVDVEGLRSLSQPWPGGFQ